MKRMTWLVVALVLAVGGMISIYGLQTYESSRELTRSTTLSERQSVVQDLAVALEHYRRLSAGFRKMSEQSIAQAKSELRGAINEAVARLDRLDPTPEERAWGQRLNQQISDFMVMSARLEPMLFLRDVYLKPEARSAHEAMVQTLEDLRKSARARQEAVRAEAESRRTRLTRALLASAAGVIGVMALLLLNVFAAYVRPARRLLERAREIRKGKLRRQAPSRLSGLHAEIESSIDELAYAADAQKRDRHRFVTAVATELRVPLVPLQTSASLLASVSDRLGPAERADASEVVRRSIAKLSRTLDDLTDTLCLESGEIKLEEKIADLRDVVASAVAVLGGPGSSHEFRTFLPSMPLWAFVDPQRLERVIVNLASKAMQYSPQGGAIDITLHRAVKGSSAAAEISIHEGSQERALTAKASGPEQELVRHWASENGFGLALSQKIVEAHGGTVTAAGLAGTSVVFTIRVPESRIAGNLPERPGFKIAEPLAPLGAGLLSRD